MIDFYWPWAFLLLPLPLLGWRLLPPRHYNQALYLPFFHRLTQHDGGGRPQWMNRKHLLPALIWILMVLALAQPLWIGDNQPKPQSGRDLMLLIDVSGSMRQMDFQRDGKPVDRLGAVKAVASRFVEGRRGDRVGLILFGDRPYLRASPSHDHDAILELIDEAEIALAGESTAIGDAVGLAIKRMRPLVAKTRVAVLLTDGANNEGRILPRQAARLAAAENIRVYTIGVGAPDAPAPNPYGIWSSRDAGRFERGVLEEMAQLTDGRFFHVLDADGLKAAYDQLDLLEPALGREVFKYLADPLYPWPLAAALLLSLIAASLRWRH